MKLIWLKGPYSWVGSLPEHGAEPNELFKLSRPPRNRNVVKLAHSLLEIGGEAVAILFVAAPASALFLEYGEITPFSKIRVKRGKPRECHVNASLLWNKHRSRYRIATGYALSNDGMWRRHSWLLEKDVLIETTERRDRYFGVILSDEQAEAFHQSYREYD